jgi:hypothetical protein
MAVLALSLANGCPWQSYNGLVTARITISATVGVAPLQVEVSGDASTSSVSRELTYEWDFGDGTMADTVEATHIYETIGTYIILLRVTDADGNVGTASVYVQVGAIPVAVLQADTNAGPLPLTVQFDGATSHVEGDVIIAHYWDFGDGSDIDEQPAPAHTYEQAGVYTATLRVVATTGLECTSTTRIVAGGSIGSLDMCDVHEVILSPTQTDNNVCMFEVWFKAEGDGGKLISYAGDWMTLSVYPKHDRVMLYVAPHEGCATARDLAGQWHHITLVYNKTNPWRPGSATVYLDGEHLMRVTQSGFNGLPTPMPLPWWEAIDWTSLTFGRYFSGRVAEMRWWSAEVSRDTRWSRLDPNTPNLIGYWRLDDGSGDTLTNQCGPDGVCHTYVNDAVCDLIWSADGPPLTAE